MSDRATITAYADQQPTVLTEFPDDGYETYERVVVSTQKDWGVRHVHFVPTKRSGEVVGWHVQYDVQARGRTL